MSSQKKQAKFTQGSIMKHIVVMSSSGAIGLMAIFVVDLVDMFFISLLGQIELAAAIGFAGTILFFSTSVSIGTSIATGALVSRALGSGKMKKARNISGSVLIYSALFSLVTISLVLGFIDPILSMLGAEGEAAQKAKDYLYIIMPSGPIMAMGMSAGAALRAIGDAKRSMLATLLAAVVNGILDPIFIFGLSMDIQGAALASVIARFVVFGFSLKVLICKYDLIRIPQLKTFINHSKSIFEIAVPAIITNTATPFANAIVTAQIAVYGAEYVAGFAVIGRLIPVSFALIFSLSGAVGPILGQNFGAKRFDRLKDVITDSVKFVTFYCIVISIVLYFSQSLVISLFSLTGDAASLVGVFCTFVAITFIFNGTLFVSNAAFNNLNHPTWSTLLNVGKASIGTIPFVYYGSMIAGAKGVLIGQALGSVIFGILGFMLVKHLINGLAQEQSY